MGSRLQEGRGPLSSRLPKPTRQRKTSKTRLLVLKQQRRGLPLHLTMRNGLYSPTRNPREAVQIPIQVLDKEVAPVYPTLPAEESTTTSARCSTFSSRSRSRQRNVPGIPLGCFAVVLSAGNPILIYLGSSIGRASTL